MHVLFSIPSRCRSPLTSLLFPMFPGLPISSRSCSRLAKRPRREAVHSTRNIRNRVPMPFDFPQSVSFSHRLNSNHNNNDGANIIPPLPPPPTAWYDLSI